jgi:LytS/YehU family sensor histidine kinase
MNAHFIFNALNSINSLIWQQLPEKASHLLSQFARLMRLTLEHTRSGWIPLSEELEALKAYVELESTRLNHPPVFSITVPPDMDTGEIQIPPMLVQPLVENVFLHVLAILPAPGELHIRVSRGGNGLWIDVEDNGPSFEGIGYPQVEKAHKSMASGIIADRLSLLSRQMNFEASCTRFQESGRTIARITLPLVEDL